MAGRCGTWKIPTIPPTEAEPWKQYYIELWTPEVNEHYMQIYQNALADVPKINYFELRFVGTLMKPVGLGQ